MVGDRAQYYVRRQREDFLRLCHRWWGAAPGLRLRAARRCLAPSMRCRAAVASVSRPALVRRVASSRSLARVFRMSMAFCAGDPVTGVPVRSRDRLPSSLGRLGSDALGDRAGDHRRLRGQPPRRDQCVRSARADLTSGLACSAPSTVTEAIDARASSGVTSPATLASPSTLMCSISPLFRAASRSARL